MQTYNFKELPAQQTNLALLLSYTWLLRNLSVTIGLYSATIYFCLTFFKPCSQKGDLQHISHARNVLDCRALPFLNDLLLATCCVSDIHTASGEPQKIFRWLQSTLWWLALNAQMSRIRALIS